MRVKMINGHNVGDRLWDNGVRAGVRWDGFAGIEDVASDAIRAVDRLTASERAVGFVSVGHAVYLTPSS